jgi:hypothetical protein
MTLCLVIFLTAAVQSVSKFVCLYPSVCDDCFLTLTVSELVYYGLTCEFMWNHKSGGSR